MGAIIKHSNLTPAGLLTTTCSNWLTPPCEPGQHLRGEMLVCLCSSWQGSLWHAACARAGALHSCGDQYGTQGWTPDPTVAPLWALGAVTTQDKQTSLFICHTRALTPRCKDPHKGCKVQPQRCTTAASAALVYVTYIKVHPLAASSSLPPRLSAQPATIIHHLKTALALPKGSGCHLPTQFLAVSTDGYNHTVKFPRKLGGWREREGSRTYWDRVLFFFKGIKRGEFLFDSQLP